jgi:diacylglycerol kinase family enzyme
VEVVCNTASGGVGPDAPEQLEQTFADFGIAAHVCAPRAGELADCLRAAIDSSPDLLVVLAGDGTIRAAAELCGPDGPTIAPLPGGTMNLLPHAIYGPRTWRDALGLALSKGAPQMLGGGEVDGRCFLCGAILGTAALWQPAREAVRHGKIRIALARADRALRRAFTGRLRYTLDAGPRCKAGALGFICPVVSRVLTDRSAVLEAAAFDLNSAADVVNLGLHALIDDWRHARGVETVGCETARVWSAEDIPAILDGEAVRLPAAAEVRFRPAVAKVLRPPQELGA